MDVLGFLARKESASRLRILATAQPSAKSFAR
jgi:hypothetical protein